MSKIKLGKTADSRSRRKPKTLDLTEEALLLKSELEKQSSFAIYLLKKGYGTKTVKCYVKDAEKFKTWTEKENLLIETITYADMLAYIQSFGKHVKQRTISSHVNSIKRYFDYLKTTSVVSENPTSHIKIKGIKRRILYEILNKQELESLYHNFEIPEEKGKDKNQNWYKISIRSSKRNKVILGLIIYQGLSSRDLSELREKDVKLREGKIFIAESRSSNERTLKLEAHQVLDMMEYRLTVRPELLKLHQKSSETFLVNSCGGSHFSNVMSYLIKQLKRQNSKVKNVQQIRTSVITHWLKVYNLREVQYMAGHRYVSSTEAYLINDLEDLQEDIMKFHPIGCEGE